MYTCAYDNGRCKMNTNENEVCKVLIVHKALVEKAKENMPN